MNDFATLRQQLVEAKFNLRNAKDNYETTRAVCELAVTTTGKNAEDRKRELTVAVANDETYKSALDWLREWELKVDRIQAQLDTAEDERREREWAIRARLADALGGSGHEDQAFDQQADRRVINTVWNVSGARDRAVREMDELFQK